MEPEENTQKTTNETPGDVVPSMNKEAGASIIRAALDEGDVEVRKLASRIGWSFPRVLSRMRTYAKNSNKPLMKVKAGVYRLEK